MKIKWNKYIHRYMDFKEILKIIQIKILKHKRDYIKNQFKNNFNQFKKKMHENLY